jgi:tetratricopeptide (TPR) repeat protein
LAYHFAKKPDWDRATTYFSIAVKLKFDTADIFNDWGYCLHKRRASAEAAEKLEEAVRRNPRLQAAHHNLADVRFQLAVDARVRAKTARRTGSAVVAALQDELAQDYLGEAIEHIENARNLGPPSADLEYLAARIYARASVEIPRNSDPAVAAAREQEFIEKALGSCEEAHKLGKSPGDLADLAASVPRLKECARFQKLLEPKTDAPNPIRPKLLIDPYPDIRSRLIGVRR